MKLTINLDDIAIDEYGVTVAEIIRDEIKATIRSAVRAEIKESGKAIRAEVQKVAKDALASMRGERVREIARRMAGEL